MLHVRRQQLGIFNPLSWLEDKISNASGCDLIPTQWLPVVKQLVSQYGCSDAGKASIAAGLAAIPGYGPAIAAFGTPLVIGCACKGQSTAPTTQPTSPFKNTLLIAGLAALGIGGIVFAMQRRPRTEATSSSALPAPPPETKSARKEKKRK